MKNSTLTFFILFSFFALYSQKEITIKAIPGDAEIFRIINGGGEIKMGVGTAALHLDRDVPYVFEARKDGYLPVQKTIVRMKKNGNPFLRLELVDRIVKINASPADARIFVNNADRGTSPFTVIIPKGQSATVDIKKPGYQPQTKTYYNKEGQDEPESSHLFKLEDRLISIKANPADATISVDGKKQGDGSADIVIAKDKCINVKVEKLGYSSVEVQYCNKDNEKAPPLSEEIRLKDREAKFNVIPDDAEIFVDGKKVGQGSYIVKIPEGKTTQVLIKRLTYVSQKWDLANKADMQAPESAYPVTMIEDEAFKESEESSQANKNFGVEVNGGTTSKEAWKRLTSIIQNVFEEIEITDETTSYLRTAWVGRTFNQKTAFPSVIRTRVVVTNGGSNPLRYNVKIQSEISKDDCLLPTPNLDQCFGPWARILRKYNDLQSEISRRLQ